MACFANIALAALHGSGWSEVGHHIVHVVSFKISYVVERELRYLVSYASSGNTCRNCISSLSRPIFSGGSASSISQCYCGRTGLDFLSPRTNERTSVYCRGCLLCRSEYWIICITTAVWSAVPINTPCGTVAYGGCGGFGKNVHCVGGFLDCWNIIKLTL